MTDADANISNPIHALRGFLVLDAMVRLLIYSGAFCLTVATMTALNAWPGPSLIGAHFQDAWRWGQAIILMIVLFNFFYVVILFVLRLPIPQPREGTYTLAPGKPVDRQLIWSCLIATLTKARYEAPFPAFLVFHVANIPPLCWLMSAVFGPKSRSCYVTEPQIIDPHMVTIGRNVVIGFGSIVAGHYQDRGRVVLRKTIIEDDVLIGALCGIAGAHIKKGALLGAGSIVVSGSVIGPGEYWSGNPARKRRRATPEDRQREADRRADESSNKGTGQV